MSQLSKTANTAILSEAANIAILKVLRHCGEQARQAAAQPFEVYEKGHEDFVTTVDQALDRHLSEAFSTQFPDDGIVTEENQASTSAFLAQRPRIWFIDPIDGTEDFINHGEHYSIMVGLLIQNQPQAGWVYAPAQHQMYWGGPDWGLFQQTDDGQIIPLEPQRPQPDQPQRMLLGDRDQRRFGKAIAEQIPQLEFNCVGSFGLKVLEVIKGNAGGYVYLNGRVKLWDTTGPLALAKAAGLVCCDLDGNPIRFDFASVYPPTLIHRQPMIIGWPTWVEALRPAVRQAVLAVRCRELSLN